MSEPDVEVRLAGREEKPALANLFQLYVHDFSEQWAGRDDSELGDDGLFSPYPHLDAYWGEAGRLPFLIRVGGHVAGFALVNAHSHSGLTVDRNVAEFFVVRKHRRGGAGTRRADHFSGAIPVCGKPPWRGATWRPSRSGAGPSGAARGFRASTNSTTRPRSGTAPNSRVPD